MMKFLAFGYEQEIWLDKNTGGVCLSISSKALTITGVDDRRYWSHISTEESRCVYHSRIISIVLLHVM